MTYPKFSIHKRSEFSKMLRNRVNTYFTANNLSKHANGSMITKTTLALLLFVAPLTIINTGLIQYTPFLFTLYILSGFGMAGIGMGVMHDAIHGSYSKNPKINHLLGYTMNLIGANATVWRIQHNVLHHTYTNIQHSDDDINTPFFLRFSPHTKRYLIHKYQCFYVWFFYGISTLSWVTFKDFIRMRRYKKRGHLEDKATYKREFFKLVVWKILYYSYALVLPIIFVPKAAWIVILAFLAMHMITGLLISCIFQVAHIIPDTDFPVADDKGNIANEWFIHQLTTTSNFAPKSRLFSWLIGGLNYQIEHHLFPNICHVHYRKISRIVSQTATEFDLPYHSKDSFLEALLAHIKMLYRLGRDNKMLINHNLACVDKS